MIRLRKHPQFWLLAALICLAFQANLGDRHSSADRLLGVHHSRHSNTFPNVVRQSPGTQPAGSKVDAPFLPSPVFGGRPAQLVSLISAGDVRPAFEGTPHSTRGRSPPLS